MKQLAAVQGLLEGASRVMLRRHLETCVATAMREGRTAGG
jgi:DNA-binding FrmR family transcriptional regulator